MGKILFMIIGILTILFIAGCNTPTTKDIITVNSSDITNSVTIDNSGSTNTQATQTQLADSGPYKYCLENNGTILSTNPKQCIFDGVTYFQYTGNVMQLRFCTSYFDGCNTCIVNNGTIGGCTKKACNAENTDTPRCLESTEKPPQGISFTPQIMANFTCDEGNISILFDNVAHTATMTMNGKDTLLAQIITGSGAAYSNQKMTFYNHGSEAMVYDAVNNSNQILTNCISE
jgi:membrane-bound inhibitor of C-type lysozyme